MRRQRACVLVQSRRNGQVAKRFFRKLLTRLRYAPRTLITYKLKSYGAAKEKTAPGIKHRQHQGLSNCAEVSHQPTRQRERQMQRFKSPGHAQRVLLARAQINNPFRCQRNHLPAAQLHAVRNQAFFLWNEVIGIKLTK